VPELVMAERKTIKVFSRVDEYGVIVIETKSTQRIPVSVAFLRPFMASSVLVLV